MILPEQVDAETRRDLPKPSIDTGMGLERMAAVLQNKTSNYDTDLFQPVLRAVGDLAGVKYGAAESSDISLRVVADHIRSTTFLIGDGVIPSNEWRGYVLRKIMRRAMRHGKHLGLTEPFMHKLVAVLDAEMGDAYPGIRTGRAMIEKTILAEEHRFEAVLTEGLPRLEAELAPYFAEHAKVDLTPAARRPHNTFLQPDGPRRWIARQRIVSPDGECDFMIEGAVDLTEAKAPGEPLVELIRIGT